MYQSSASWALLFRSLVLLVGMTLTPLNLELPFLFLEVRWRESGLRIGVEWPSEQQDEGLGLVDLVVHPAAALGHSDRAPLHFVQEAAARNLLIDLLGEQNVPVLIEVIGVLLGVLDLVGEVRHI